MSLWLCEHRGVKHQACGPNCQANCKNVKKKCFHHIYILHHNKDNQSLNLYYYFDTFLPTQDETGLNVAPDLKCVWHPCIKKKAINTKMSQCEKRYDNSFDKI